ncbi:MAG: hypothetical protein IKI58_02075 [Oscillospiraceae bacterium]|nr:hypothetical protein [Oscillospiraceae bacterium]
MNRISRRAPAWSALQTASLLLLCRLTAFFCCDAPYTAAYAQGMFAAALTEAALLLPLLLFRKSLRIPEPLLWGYRFFSLVSAAYLSARGFRLFCLLHLEAPHLFAGMFFLTLLFTVSRTQAATARTAVLLLVTVSAAFLLLPVSGIRSAHMISLYTSGSFSDAFFREFRNSPETALFPLLITRQKAKEQYAPHACAVWLTGRLVILPLLVLFGAMQNGRLTAWKGSPFFLLLARTPLSDAIRTDGFWMLFAAGCSVLSITFFLQQAMPPFRMPVRKLFSVMLPYPALTLFFLRTNRHGTGIGIAALSLGILLPCMLLLIQRIKSRMHYRMHYNSISERNLS